MRPTRLQVETKVAPGAFMPDGSFRDDAFESERGPADALVRSLVRQRRAGHVNPSEAVSLIRSARMEKMFPWLEQWETASDWRLAWACTSAEQVIKSAGEGADASRDPIKPWGQE